MDSGLASVLLIVALLAIASVIGVLLQRRDGRTRRAAAQDDVVTLRSLDLDTPPGEGAVVVQISSAVCSPCRAAARTWRSVLPEGRHLELDIEQHTGVAERLGVWRTPSSFVFDEEGVLLARVDGVPNPAQARASLTPTQ